MRLGISTRSAQRGQALVFVTIVMLVVMLALVTMYSMGQLTTAKMKLQNTADAAAYSAALAQARDYNFSAYTNRAMVANQVVIAQLVGLTSWARNYNSTFQTLTPQVEWMAQGIVGRFMWSLPIRGLRPAARTFNRAMDTAAPCEMPSSTNGFVRCAASTIVSRSRTRRSSDRSRTFQSLIPQPRSS